MFKKIAFIHYPTRDLQRALEFYRDVLGLKLLVQNEEWIEFEIGDQRLALRKVDALPQTAEGTQPAGAMIWLEAKPIENLIANLESKNINFLSGLGIFSYGKLRTFSDPDGNPIGLYEPPEKE